MEKKRKNQNHLVLSVDELAIGRKAAFANARALVTEAKLLLAHGHFARAKFLAQIAGEEIGKGFLLAGETIRSLVEEIDWKKFWKNFRSHKHKLEAVMLTETTLSPALSVAEREDEFATLKTRAADLEQGKLWSLYVDFIEGTFRLPQNIVSPKTARNSVTWAEGRLAMLAHFERVYAVKPPEQWTQKEAERLKQQMLEAAAAPPPSEC